MLSNGYSCPILMKKIISFRPDFRKILKFVFRGHRPVGNELFHTYGRMDRQAEIQDEAISYFSQFCENYGKRTKKLCQTHRHSALVHKNIYEFFFYGASFHFRRARLITDGVQNYFTSILDLFNQKVMQY